MSAQKSEKSTDSRQSIKSEKSGRPSRTSARTGARTGKKRKSQSRPRGSSKSTARRVSDTIWSERPNWHRAIIVIAVMMVFSVTALFSLGVFAPDPESEKQREAVRVADGMQREMNAVSASRDEIRGILSSAIPSSPQELTDLAGQVDRWGREFSLLQLKLLATSGQSEATVYQDFLPQVAHFYVEAAENLKLLATAGDDERIALFDQAKRLTALADSDEAGAYLGLAQSVGLDKSLAPAESHPLVVDDIIGRLPAKSPYAPPGEVLAEDSALSGIPAYKVPGVESQSPQAWAAGMARVVRDESVTETTGAVCEDVKAVVRSGAPISLQRYSDFLAVFARTGNALGAQTPPDGVQVAYAGVIRANRTYEEAAVTARIAGGAGANRETLLTKLERLTLMSGTQWQWAGETARVEGIRLAIPDACDLEYRTLILTPWDAREELTKTLGVGGG